MIHQSEGPVAGVVATSERGGGLAVLVRRLLQVRSRIHVAHLMESPKEGLIALLPTVIRLQALNMGDNCGVHTAKSAPLQFTPKGVDGVANGECVAVRRFAISSNDEFPHQIIKTTPKVHHDVAELEAECTGSVLFRDKTSHCPEGTVALKGALWITHEAIGISLEVFGHILPKTVQVLACPIEF